MKSTGLKLTLGVLALAMVATANAGVIVDTTPRVDHANLTANAGQSFTTGTLGAENKLSTIEVFGPGAAGGSDPIDGPFTLKLYTNDAAANVWSPDTLLATSDSGAMVVGGSTVFTFDSEPTLSDSTVYLFVYSDATGTPVDVRVGLTNGANSIADGSVFSNDGTPFSNAYDTTMKITTVVPEPATMSLLALGGIAMLRRRKK